MSSGKKLDALADSLRPEQIVDLFGGLSDFQKAVVARLIRDALLAVRDDERERVLMAMMCSAMVRPES